MENKVVLVTGASNGIGSCIARTFAENGYIVVVNYNKSKTSAENLVENLNKSGFAALSIKANVNEPSEVENMFAEIIRNFGHIDVLVNNAGISSTNLLIDETDININQVISTNLLGTIYCCRQASKYMMFRQSGKIINISSIWGLYGASNETVYSASKGGIIAFTKALSKELIYSNITVNAIAPGVVDTNMMKSFSETELNQIKNEIPLKRFARPEEIADVCLFLASDKASYITGQTIQIDGGYCN